MMDKLPWRQKRLAISQLSGGVMGALFICSCEAKLTFKEQMNQIQESSVDSNSLPTRIEQINPVMIVKKFKDGSEIFLRITFSNKVYVVGGGEVNLLLLVGHREQAARYHSGSGSEFLLFTLELRGEDISENLQIKGSQALSMGLNTRIVDQYDRDIGLLVPSGEQSGLLGAGKVVPIERIAHASVPSSTPVGPFNPTSDSPSSSSPKSSSTPVVTAESPVPESDAPPAPAPVQPIDPALSSTPTPAPIPAPSPQNLPSYTIGGTITGLGAGKALVLRDQDGIQLTLSSNGSFSFVNPLIQGKSYEISIQIRPSRQGCTVENGTGVVQGSVTNIAINCRDSFTEQVGYVGVNALGQTISKDGLGHFFVGAYSTGDVDGVVPLQTGTFFTSVTKFSEKGTKIWRSQQAARSLSSTTYAGGFSAADPSGNVYSIGTTIDGLDGNVMIGLYNFYVVKHNANGDKQWLRQLGHGETLWGVYSYIRPTSIAVDGVGNVLVCGIVYGALDGNTVTSVYEATTFVTKYDSSGQKQWTRQFVGLVANFGFGVAFDPMGQIAIAGSTRGTFHGATLSGSEDGYVLKLDAQGQPLWTRTIGGTGGITIPRSVVTDTQGNLIVSGYTQASLGDNVLIGTRDIFVAKYDVSGNRLWVKQNGVAGANTSQGKVSLDSAQNIYITGTTTGALDGNVLTGTQDFFVTKFDSSGTKLWTRQMGAPGKSSSSTNLVVFDQGHMVIVGYTAGNLDGNTLRGVGDIFVTHLWD